MKPNYFFLKFLLGIILVSLSWCTKAARPLWTFTPLTPTTVTVPMNGTATIAYVVTNQSKQPHILMMTPIYGITQVTAGGACQALFPLNYLESCVLVLQVNGSALTSGIVGGPVVCQLGNPLQCYQPSLPNSLNITLLRQNQGTVGGEVSGLVGTVVLRNGSDVLSISSDGEFTFPTPLTEGQPYNVVVQTNPSGQTCTVFNGTGVMGSTSVNDVVVTCSTNAYSVGGTISGLTGPNPVVLQLNGGELVSRTTNGVYTFNTPVAEGSPYEVTIQSSPPNQTCTIENPDGIMGGANVTNVNVVCSTTSFTVGGSVSGLIGRVIIETNNQVLTITSNGPFTFPNTLANGSTYNVVVDQQPVTQTCTVTNGTGTISGANVTNVQVTCATGITTLTAQPRATVAVGGTITGLVVQNTGNFGAINVRAILPSGWTNVVQDATNCTLVLPGASCTLNFSSTTPYVSNDFQITGDNVRTPATSIIAFTINGYYVYAVNSATAYRIVNNTQLAAGNLEWSTDNVYIAGADSFTNGFANTQAIAASPFGFAAKGCTLLPPSNTWYLPAVCETEFPNSSFSQCSGTPSFRSLITSGFLTYNTKTSPTSGLPVFTFTSTQQPQNPVNAAYAANLSTTVGASAEFKNEPFPVLCTSIVIYP